MIALLLNGSVFQAKVIAEDLEYQALRRRTERRFAALKSAKRLYEVKREPTATPKQSSARNLTAVERANLYSNQFTNASTAEHGYSPGSALATVLGVSSSYLGTDR